MIPYWLLFLFPAYAALNERLRYRPLEGDKLLWRLTGLLLAVLIGFRYEVGGDWTSYLEYLESAADMHFSEIFLQNDLGYILINWLAARAGLGIWAVNLACGLFFSWGLLTFARQQPRPWLTLLVAVPYLIIVVAMGYSRQGVAIGFALLALSRFSKGSTLGFLMLMAVAATFHKTVIILLPVAMLTTMKNRIWIGSWVGVTTFILYYLLLSDSVPHLISSYLEAEYQSQGASIRIAMNALPAALFLFLRRRFALSKREQELWTSFSVGALSLIALLIFCPSSAAVDRIALYFIPLQLFVLSRLPEALNPAGGMRREIVFGVIAYSAIVQFVWLNFASYSYAWLPYKFYPL